MACATFASARANNHSKTTQPLTIWRNYVTTTTPFVRVSTLVYRMISHHVPSPMAASRSLMFPNGSHTHHGRFQRKTVALANIQEPQPFHHLPRTRHRNFQPRAQKKQNTTVDLPARKPASGSIPPGRTCLGLVCHGHQQRMNRSLKKEGLCALSVAKVQIGVRPEAQVPPNSAQRRKCVRTALHYRSWINTIECVGR